MSAIILMDADDPEFCYILSGEEDNMVFDSVDAADRYLQRNAKNGWCTRIIEID